jgi:hypothetical protein
MTRGPVWPGPGPVTWAGAIIIQLQGQFRWGLVPALQGVVLRFNVIAVYMAGDAVLACAHDDDV